MLVHRIAGAALAVVLSVVLVFAAIAQDKQPSATVEIDQAQIALILSGKFGGGKLHYKGETYEFELGGLGLVGLGVASFKAKGDVYDLEKLEDFYGAYFEAQAGAGAGTATAGGQWMINTNGVSMRLETEQEGLVLSIGANGMNVQPRRE